MGTPTDPNDASFIQVDLVHSSGNTCKASANRIAGLRHQLQIRTRCSRPDTHIVGDTYIANSQGQLCKKGEPAIIQHFHVLKSGEGSGGSGCGVPFQSDWLRVDFIRAEDSAGVCSTCQSDVE
jgi:hypothetical protein